MQLRPLHGRDGAGIQSSPLLMRNHVRPALHSGQGYVQLRPSSLAYAVCAVLLTVAAMAVPLESMAEDEEIPRINIIQSDRGKVTGSDETVELPEAVQFSELKESQRYAYDVELRDLFFASAKYQSLLGNHFESALIWRTEIDQHQAVDNRELDTLYTLSYLTGYRIGEDALRYGLMPERVGEMEFFLNEDLPSSVFRTNLLALAGSYYNKGFSTEVIGTLEDASTASSEQAQDRLEFLAHSEYTERQFEDSSDNFDRISVEDDDDIFFALGPHNYGAALVKANEVEDGLDELIAVGEIDGGNDPNLWALKDRANLALGYYLLESNLPQEALEYFTRVRIIGPFSTPALLGTGWSRLALGDFKQALVTWTYLRDNEEVTDPYVLEAHLGIPYAYSKLEIYGRAAVNFGQAIDTLEAEQLRVEDSMTAIRVGLLLEKIDSQEWIDYGDEWLYRLREEADAPETRYLLTLMTQREFQHALTNYRDAIELERTLQGWDMQLEALLDIVRERRNFYNRLLGKLQPRLEALFDRIREITLRADEIERELLILLDQPQPVKLATTSELQIRQELDAINASVSPARGHSDMSESIAGLDRLYGIIDWEQRRFYYPRLTDAINAVEDLQPIIEDTNAVHDQTKRDLLIATASYLGHEVTIRRMRAQLKRLARRATGVRNLQGQYLNEIAMVTLDDHLYRINSYLFKSRFAVAEAYDRKVTVDKAKLREEQIKANAPPEAAAEPSTDAASDATAPGSEGDTDAAPADGEAGDGEATDSAAEPATPAGSSIAPIAPIGQTPSPEAEQSDETDTDSTPQTPPTDTPSPDQDDASPDADSGSDGASDAGDSDAGSDGNSDDDASAGGGDDSSDSGDSP